MRWIALPLVLAVLLVSPACEDDNVTEVATATQQSATAGPSPTVEPTAQEAEAEAQRLLSLAPSADEFGAVFPDLAPFEQELREDLGQEYEHVDLAGHGFVAGYTAFYRPSDESLGAYISLASFGDARGASDAMAEMIAIEFSQPGTATFEVDEGDEAYGIEVGGLTIVLLRQGRVVAFMVIPSGEDRREGMGELARDVVRRIEDAPAQ